MNAGQLGLGSSRPESCRPGVKSAWSHIKPCRNVFNKKEFIQQKLEEGLRNIIFHFLYRTSDTLYQLMSVDIVSLTALIILFFLKQSAPFMLITLIRLLIANTDFTH